MRVRNVLARRVFIASTSMIRVGRHYGRGLAELAVEAASKAVAEAGVEPDTVIVANMVGEVMQEQANLAPLIVESLGMRGRPAIRVEVGQGSGLAALYTAVSMVASGLSDIALVVGVEKLTDYPSASAVSAMSTALNAEYEAYYGVTPAAIAALAMRYYMEKYDVSRDEMSEWPVLMHSNGAENPYAQIRKKIRREDVAKSQVIADPITMLDSSPIGDGAAAVIVASEEGLRKHQSDPKSAVEVAGIAAVTDYLTYSLRSEPDRIPAAAEAVKRALSMAKLELSSIDVVELHDDYTITGIVLLEEAGFAEKGRAAKELANGRFHPGDKPTVNPSGGLKARGHPLGATGVYQAAEVAQQLLGSFPGVKVDGAETGLVLGLSGYGAEAFAIIMRRV